MRSKRLDLSGLCKTGLSSAGFNSGLPGLVMIKNLRSNGSEWVGCTAESTTSLASTAIPFVLYETDYLIKSDGIYSVAGVKLFAHVFSGYLKIVDLIKVVWIQDSSTTIFCDSTGFSYTNPTSLSVPIANDLVMLNGQIIAGGSTGNVDNGFVKWSDIALEDFTISKQNTAGLAHPNIGAVLRTAAIFDSLVLLGTRGSCLMKYAEQTFGFKSLQLPSLRDIQVCASTSTYGFYISKENHLIRFDGGGGFEDLGFEWLCRDVLTIRYFKSRNWIVLSTASNSFIIDQSGMFSFGYKIYGEGISRLYTVPEFEQATYGFRTTFMHFGKTGLKNLREIVVLDGLTSTTTRTIKGYSEDLLTSRGTTSMNKHGAAKYPLAGLRMAIEYESSENPTIGSFSVDIIDTDKRFGNSYTPYGGLRDNQASS